MDRLSNGTQSATPPVNPGIIGAPGYPVPGNAALGQLGSIRDAFQDYVVWEELRNIIVGLGGVPDKGATDQIITLLKAKFMSRAAVTGGRTNLSYTPTAGQTYQNTLTFTPPVPGLVVATGIVNLAGSLAGAGGPQQQPVGCSHQVVIGATAVGYESTVGSMSIQGLLNVAAGSTIQVAQQYATLAGAAGPWVAVSQSLSFFFLPT